MSHHPDPTSPTPPAAEQEPRWTPGLECAWCGTSLSPSDLEWGAKPCRNREGEHFCRPSHRSASNRARNALLARSN